MRIIFLFLLAALAAAPAAGDTARGRVFEDLNGDGFYDDGEPGVPDVRVSNGLGIIATDSNGEYRIDVGDEAIVFIVKPKGFLTPVNELQIPQFYYIHQPAGSPPSLRYPGVAPTGSLPDHINFPLVRHREPTRFKAILFADPQPQSGAEIDYIRDDVLAELVGTDAKFGMTVGDIMFDDLSLFPRSNALIAQLGIPWYNVPGNHDLNFAASDDRYSLETFKRYFGPPYYSFEYGEALFVVLDNIEYRGAGLSKPGNVRNNGGHVSKFGRRQLSWLEAELARVPRDHLIVLAMHAPLETYVAPGAAVVDRAKLLDIVSGRPNLYAIAGHTHTTEHHYFAKEDGFRGPGTFHQHVLSTVSGAWWSGPFDSRGIPTTDQRDGTPNGYHILTVDGERVQARYKAAGFPADYQMRILFDVAHHGTGARGRRDYRTGELFDGRFPSSHLSAAQILVNFFDGGPRSKVGFRIDDGQYRPMTRVRRTGPYMLESSTRDNGGRKTWTRAAPSSHLYTARLPNELQPGTYRVSVEAIDEFGNSHHGHTLLELTGP